MKIMCFVRQVFLVRISLGHQGNMRFSMKRKAHSGGLPLAPGRELLWAGLAQLPCPCLVLQALPDSCPPWICLLAAGPRLSGK